MKKILFGCRLKNFGEETSNRIDELSNNVCVGKCDICCYLIYENSYKENCLIRFLRNNFLNLEYRNFTDEKAFEYIKNEYLKSFSIQEEFDV